MSYKVSGLSSIILILLTIIIADVWLFIISLSTGIIYAVIIPLLFYIVLYFYCRKCPHNADNTCRHVIPGKIAPGYRPTNPERITGKKVINSDNKYTSGEIAITLLSLLIIFVFPQYWLIQNTILLLIFWILILLAGIIIRVSVCPKCRNSNCALCKNKT